MTEKQDEARARRFGRPAVIDQILRHDDDGHPITVAQGIVERLRQGDYIEQAAAFCGVQKRCVYEWERVAARASIRAHGDLTKVELTDYERNCIDFWNAVSTATAEAHARALDTLQLLARGGIEQITTTITVDAKGGTETATRTTHTLPSEKAVTWWLERRFPDLYGQRIQVSKEPILSREEHTQALLESARQHDAEHNRSTPRQHRPAKKAAAKKTT